MLKINKDSIYKQYPPVLADESKFAALGETIAEQLAKNKDLCSNAIIYSAIDSLPEAVLDTLAYDFRVEWYDYEGTLAEKRKTIKECISVHRYKGTKYAVETALKSVYDTVKVQEWHEYGGEPYHFKVIIYDSSGNEEKRNRILAKVKYYKNLRSHLEETVFMVGLNADIKLSAAARISGMYKKIQCEVKNYGME